MIKVLYNANNCWNRGAKVDLMLWDTLDGARICLDKDEITDLINQMATLATDNPARPPVIDGVKLCSGRTLRSNILKSSRLKLYAMLVLKYCLTLGFIDSEKYYELLKKVSISKSYLMACGRLDLVYLGFIRQCTDKDLRRNKNINGDGNRYD